MTVTIDESSTRTLTVPPEAWNTPAPRKRGKKPLISYGHWWWALPAIILVIAVHYVATLTGGFFAFTDWTGLGDWSFIGLDNFVRIFQDPLMLGAVGNTLFLAFASVILTNVIGLLFALAINRMLKSRYILRTLLFMPVVLSPLAVAYVWKFIFQFDGPLNGFLGLIGLESMQKVWLADPTWSIWAILITVVWQQTGFTMVIYLAGLASVPIEVEEAAALDGAGIWGRVPARDRPGHPPVDRHRDHARHHPRAAHLRPDPRPDRRWTGRRHRDARDRRSTSRRSRSVSSGSARRSRWCSP